MSTPRLIFEKTGSLTGPDLYVEEHRGAGGLSFGANNGEVEACVTLDRSEVLTLIQAVSEWLYPVHTPEGPNRSLIEQMIERAVKDQVAAVLPLHLKNVTTVTNVCDRLVPKGVRRGSACDGCGYMWDLHRMQQPADDDPEPGDVGHRSVCALSQPIFKADDSTCAECGGRWADHPGVQAARADWLRTSRPADCDTPPPAQHPFTAVHDACGSLWEVHPRPAEPNLCKGCAKNVHPHVFADCSHCDCKWRKVDPEPQHGRLMSELPRRAPKCIECMHGWGEHTGGICWGEHAGNGCTCTRERPPQVQP